MSRSEQNPVGWDRALWAVEKYGYGLSLAAALLWFARVDVIVPLVGAHTGFLNDMAVAHKELAESHADIAESVRRNSVALAELLIIIKERDGYDEDN